MGLCPSNCGTVTLVSNPQENCEDSQRFVTPSRMLFYPCSFDLPDPIEGHIKPYFDNGTIVASSKLRNIAFGDPTTQDFVVNDCQPPKRIVVGREITFEDTVAVEYGVDSPLVNNPYWDYKFWLDKQNQQISLHLMIAYCNGDVRIAKDPSGNPLSISVYPFLNYERPSQSGGPTLEFKRVSIMVNGDPINLSVIPAFNLVDEGIDL